MNIPNQSHNNSSLRNKGLNIFNKLEQCDKNNKIHVLLSALTLLISISSILYLNIKIPLIGDDYVYSFIYLTNERVGSLVDILTSQQIHYQSWGGRSVVHFIAQAILMIKVPLVIDLINSLAFIGLILCMQLHIIGRFKYNCKLYILLFVLMWLLQPAFAETAIWITGSANYLWGTLIILTFLLPFRLYQNKQNSIIQNTLYAILMFIAGVISGWTNENTAASMLIIIVAFLFYYKKNKWTIPLWAYIGLGGAIIGYIIMIIAPGNFIRAEGTSNSPFLMVYRLLTHTQSFVDYLGILNLGVVILLILYLKFSEKKNKTILHLSLIYSIGTIVSIYTMIMSPAFPARAWFGTITLNIIVFGLIFQNLNTKEPFIQNIKNTIIVFCIISFSFTFYEAYKDVTEIDKIWKERMVIIDESKKNGTNTIVFDEYQAKTKFGLGDAHYALKYMSQYYDIDIQLEKK